MTMTNAPSPSAAQGVRGRNLADGDWDCEPTLEKIVPFTMPPVSLDALRDVAQLVVAVITQDIPGHFVQCGVWRGGTAFLMADLLRRAGAADRKVWLFDSWEGTPPPQAIDGPYAQECITDPTNPLHRDNCAVSLEEVQKSAADLGLAPYTELVKVWFDQTLPAHRTRIGPIALLHIDCDWYVSVRSCLENLYDQVSDGGFLFIDDYYHYDGCAVAVHEFLGSRHLAYRLETVRGDWGGCEYHYGARLRKGAPNWPWEHRLRRASQEIVALVPEGETFLLVDERQFGAAVPAGRRAVPFLEHDGVYFGRPEDDATAIRELERMRRQGAHFIVFAWSAFWWLEAYPDFHRQLRARFRCILENERLIAFDLREA
jgi:hypothetical protein